MPSISDTKQEIAAAVSSVPGLTCYAVRPKILRPGDAFIRWQGWGRGEGPGGAAFETTYAVVIVTPQGSESDADEWIYEHADTIEAVLRPVLYVDSFQPTLLPAEAKPGGMFTLTITGRTE